jgi:predicted CXXCH cytochrome family protein
MTIIISARRIKGLFCTNQWWTAVVLTTIMPLILCLPVQSADFTFCHSCHKEVLEDVFRTYLHVPFMQQRCGECHIPKNLPDSAEMDDPASLKDRRKIIWLGESVMADVNHGFVLPDAKVGSALVVEVLGNGGAYSRQEVAVPTLTQLAEVKDSGKPPVLSGVRVLEVERGVFLSATIGWQTDTLTDALVRYGNKDLSQTAQLGNRLGRRHEVVLNNLKPDQTYRFSVVSTDLFGRSQTSEPLTFSTSRPLVAELPAQPGTPPESSEEAGVASHFRRLGTSYLFELTLDQPASVFVGTGEVVLKQPLPNRSDGPTGGDDRHHEGLSSKRVVALEACRSCHKNQSTATHPVNVYPKPGMIIPPEYPTLPDGRITCRSCHDSHSSENEFLTIKRDKRELCVGCHRDML